MISRDLEERARCYTDAGQWKHSWHWDRDGNGYPTRKGAEKMLHDLECECSYGELGMYLEIEQRTKELVESIRERYRIADEIRAGMEKME